MWKSSIGLLPIPPRAWVVGDRPLECSLESRGRHFGGLFEQCLKPLGGSFGGYFRALGGLLGPLGGLLGASSGLWGPSWGLLGLSRGGRLDLFIGGPPLGSLLGPSRGPLGLSWAPLGPSWGPLGPPQARLGGLLGRLGTILGASWAVLERRKAERREGTKSSKTIENQ